MADDSFHSDLFKYAVTTNMVNAAKFLADVSKGLEHVKDVNLVAMQGMLDKAGSRGPALNNLANAPRGMFIS